MIRRFLASTAAVSSALILAGTASVAGAQDLNDVGTGDAQVVPLSPLVASVSPGDSQWIAINWTSLHAEARELKVTATGGEGVEVSYPTYPVDGYSSGYFDDTLSVSEVDYTALKITVAEDAPAPHFLNVTVSYVSDTGDHTETIQMPFDNVDMGGGDDGGDDGETGNTGNTTPVVNACDELVIDSFGANPWSFQFQIRNTTSTSQGFTFLIPDANYSIDNLVLNGSGENVEMTNIANGDGTYDIVLTGSVPAYQSVGGQQPNGFGGDISPSNGEPVVGCN